MLDSWAPSQRPDTDEDVEVIVVGYGQHSSQLDELVSLHNILGYSSDSVTVQWIVANVDGFDSQERAFQLITQAAGRAGRGEKRGRAIIQAYNTDAYAIEGLNQNHLLPHYWRYR